MEKQIPMQVPLLLRNIKGQLKTNGPFTTGNDQIYNWNIEYNYNEKNHKAGSFIEDTMSDAIELVNGSVKLYKITFDSNGKEIKGAQLKEGEIINLYKTLIILKNLKLSLLLILIMQ